MIVEHASIAHRSMGEITAMMRRCHPTVIAGINAARRRMGLPLIEVTGDPSARPLQRTAPYAARKPAGGKSWPRRPRTRAEHDALRQRAGEFIAAARARLRGARVAELLRTCRQQAR